MLIPASTSAGRPAARARGKALLGLSAIVALAAPACDTGEGSGEVRGTLFLEDCRGGTARGTLESPAPFDLRPRFYAGEPLEDIRGGRRQNRLILRLQRFGGRVEVNDTLYFDIVNLYEVARCIRGRVVLAVDGTLAPDYDPTQCHWPSPAGPARVRVGPRDHVRAELMPLQTCSRPMTGVAVACADPADCPPEGWSSWLEFTAFGSAPQPQRLAHARDPVDPEFKIDFGQRIRASTVRLQLEDARVFGREDAPPTRLAAQIGGLLEGWFDFDLERSRAAQTFP